VPLFVIIVPAYRKNGQLWVIPVGRSKAATFGHLKSPHLMSV